MPSMQQNHVSHNNETHLVLLIFILIVSFVLSYTYLTRNPLTTIRYLPQDKTGSCDHSFGNWVWDESLPDKRYSENCPFLDPGFRCRRNGRPDLGYQKWRWQPYGCNLVSFDAKDFLRQGENRRIVFAGDSIGRNQWESLICMLAQGVTNQSTIQEENGNPISKHKGFLSIKFQQYNLTVQYYRVPYLVPIDRPPKNSPAEVYGAIRIDKLHWFSTKWAGADVLVFSAGHWWNHHKTIKSGHYFQEGEKINMTMEVMEAFKKSLVTLKKWAFKSLDLQKTVLFFRSYSPTHFRDGEWNNGGHCDQCTEPETDTFNVRSEPVNNRIILEAMQEMKRKMKRVGFINITYLTELRKDGHPSLHRGSGTSVDAPQDCSHWCLPGVPDTWNEILYSELVRLWFDSRTY